VPWRPLSTFADPSLPKLGNLRRVKLKDDRETNHQRAELRQPFPYALPPIPVVENTDAVSRSLEHCG